MKQTEKRNSNQAKSKKGQSDTKKNDHFGANSNTFANCSNQFVS